jgi:hypothetical protein
MNHVYACDVAGINATVKARCPRRSQASNGESISLRKDAHHTG